MVESQKEITCDQGIPEDKTGGGKEKADVSIFRGLALKWDNNPFIRQRMRGGYNLVIHYDAKLSKATNFDVERNVMNVRANHHVLKPVCQLLATNRLANINDLEYEVKQMYSLHNVVISEKAITDQAWAIRHLIQVLKQSLKADKDHPRPKRCPKDSDVKTNRFTPNRIPNVLFVGGP